MKNFFVVLGMGLCLGIFLVGVHETAAEEAIQSDTQTPGLVGVTTVDFTKRDLSVQAMVIQKNEALLLESLNRIGEKSTENNTYARGSGWFTADINPDDQYDTRLYVSENGNYNDWTIVIIYYANDTSRHYYWDEKSKVIYYSLLSANGTVLDSGRYSKGRDYELYQNALGQMTQTVGDASKRNTNEHYHSSFELLYSKLKLTLKENEWSYQIYTPGQNAFYSDLVVEKYGQFLRVIDRRDLAKPLAIILDMQNLTMTYETGRSDDYKVETFSRDENPERWNELISLIRSELLAARRLVADNYQRSLLLQLYKKLFNY